MGKLKEWLFSAKGVTVLLAVNVAMMIYISMSGGNLRATVKQQDKQMSQIMQHLDIKK